MNLTACRKAGTSAALLLASALAATAQTQTVHYPSASRPALTIQAPQGWNVVFDTSLPDQFMEIIPHKTATTVLLRTVPTPTQDLNASVNASAKYIESLYSDIAMGVASNQTLGELKGLSADGTARTKDGSIPLKITIGAYRLTQAQRVLEVIGVADTTVSNAEEKVAAMLNSIAEVK